MKVSTTGTLLKIFDTQEFESGFKKREFVVKVDEYNEIKMELQKDRVDFLDKLKEGDEVETSFFVNGRHWKDDKWFVSLTCGFIKKAGESSNAMPVNENIKVTAEDTNDDGLPF